MTRFRTDRKLQLAAIFIIVPFLIIGSFAFYVANAAGELPWQTDPTAIPVTPFANLPDFDPTETTTVPTTTPTLAN